MESRASKLISRNTQVPKPAQPSTPVANGVGKGGRSGREICPEPLTLTEACCSCIMLPNMREPLDREVRLWAIHSSLLTRLPRFVPCEHAPSCPKGKVHFGAPQRAIEMKAADAIEPRLGWLQRLLECPYDLMVDPLVVGIRDSKTPTIAERPCSSSISYQWRADIDSVP